MRSALVILQVLLADLRRRWGSALASVVAMAVGGGVFVAIYLAGAAARSSFVTTVEALAGKATHVLTRQGGLPAERLTSILALEGVIAAQPVVEGFVTLRQQGGEGDGDVVAPPLRLLGLDPFFVTPFVAQDDETRPVVKADDFRRFLLEPGSVVLPRPWAEDTGTRVGDHLTVAAAGHEVKIQVLNIYDLETFGEAARDTAILDIASAQEVLRREHVDRFDLIVDPRRESAVAAALEPGESMERPRTRGERVARMADAFRLNLLALGSLALIVGALLVFNAAQFRVVERQGLLGRLRSLGVTRRALLAAVLGEVAVLGLIGGTLGVALGAIVSQELVQPLAQSIRDLYAFVRVDAAPVTPLFAVTTISGSVLIAALAGLAPARDAAWTPPRVAGSRSQQESRYRLRLRGFVAVSILLAVSGAAFLLAPLDGWWPGLVAAFAFLASGAALLPPTLAAVLPLLKRAAERGGSLTTPLAIEALSRSLSRTGGATAALAVALAMSLGVIVMVSSFEKEVRRWIQATLLADIYVADPGESISRERARISTTAVQEIRALPEVVAVDTLRAVEVPYGTRSIFFCGIEMSQARSWERVEWIVGQPDEAMARFEAGAALISEPLANRYGLGPGDTLRLPGRFAEVSFPIAGVFRDYSMDRGYACVDRSRFEEAFGTTEIRNAAIYLREGLNSEAVASRLRERFAGRFALSIRSNAALRARVLDVFGRTFALTYLLQIISTGMALAGVAITLVALFLERAHEVAVLQALGATRRRIATIFATESLLVSVSAALFALPLGALIAWVLVAVVNLRAFGWTITFQWPWTPVLATVVLAIGAGLTATLIPMLLARRQSLATALREE